MIDSDSNHDGKIDTDDQSAAFFATSNGKQIAQIVPPSEHIISVEQLSAAKFLIVYTMQKSTMGAVFSVETGKKLRDAKIVLDEN